MVGRAVGSAILARFDAARLLALFTAIACGMCLYVVGVGGVSAGFVALGIGLFNSIMFPVIFTLTLERSSASTEATSGLLCTAIVGGAFVLLPGRLAGRRRGLHHRHHRTGCVLCRAVPVRFRRRARAGCWPCYRAPPCTDGRPVPCRRLPCTAGGRLSEAWAGCWLP